MKTEPIYSFTGSPFVDAGMWAICEWVEKKSPKDITKADLEKAISEIVPLYLTENWSKSLFSIFPNSAVTNPSGKDKKEEKLVQYFQNLAKEVAPLNESGNCVGCGKRDVKSARTKTEIPLIGSGSLINFFPNGQEGADYCPACTFAVQFSPLVLYACGKLLLLHSNSEKVMRYWSKRAIQDVRKQILEKSYTGCFDEEYTNPQNALFHMLEDLITHYDERWMEENASINLYHFTNYNQGPDVRLFTVPTEVFRFLAYMKQHERYNDWRKIVRKGFARKSNLDQEVDWAKFGEDKVYRSFRNAVYDNLLNGRSITRFFFDRMNKAVIGDWSLFSYYLEEVRGMDKKRLETLKRVGDELSEYIKNTGSVKRLNDLERVKDYGRFRNILRLITKERIKQGEDAPLFSLEEYVNYLFPEGAFGWRETQDILLFRIYENLHAWLVEQKDLSAELADEDNNEESIAEE
jgi:CRISPR-associated protein Cst1